MPPMHLKLLAVACLSCSALADINTDYFPPPQLYAGVLGGYDGGLSAEGFVIIPSLVDAVGLKLSAAYTLPLGVISEQAIIPAAAGQGTFGNAKALGAKESGSYLLFGLAGTYSLGEVTAGISPLLYAGASYGMFSGSEIYPAAGISKTYTMNSVGLNTGVVVSYALISNLSLIADIGASYYYDSSIQDGTTIFDTTYTDYSTIRNRLKFPNLAFKFKLGLQFGY